jgi:hypothetical protein
LVATVLLLLPSCGSDDSTGSSAPEIAGCNSVRYQGYTFNLGFAGGGCAPGVASFTQSGSQGGQSYCFNVTCSNGCISGVTVCSPSQSRRPGNVPDVAVMRQVAPLSDAPTATDRGDATPRR